MLADNIFGGQLEPKSHVLNAQCNYYPKIAVLLKSLLFPFAVGVVFSGSKGSSYYIYCLILYLCSL